MIGTIQRKWLIYIWFLIFEKDHRITYDSDKEGSFLVHTKPGITKFKATPEGLYAFKPPRRYLKDVAENKNIIPSNNVNGIELRHIIYTVK